MGTVAITGGGTGASAGSTGRTAGGIAGVDTMTRAGAGGGCIAQAFNSNAAPAIQKCETFPLAKMENRP
jgi:hypothetical protein